MLLRFVLSMLLIARPVIFGAVLLALNARAQVPQLLNYQGRVQVGTSDFTGAGQFKFALVNGTGSQSFWSNDGTSVAGGQPTAAVSLPVNKSLYAVLLGDAALANMTTIPASVFTNADVRLRVWFNDGASGFQLLAPDHRVASVGYAMMATAVSDGAIAANKLAAGAVTADKLAAGAVTINNLGSSPFLTLDTSGTVHVRALSTNPPPTATLITMTITNGTTAHITPNVTIIQSPRVELDGATPNRKSVSPLTVRRPVNGDPGWKIWVSDLVLGNIPTRRNVRLDYPGGIVVILEDAFPIEYFVEPGTDGVFYETLSLKPIRHTIL